MNKSPNEPVNWVVRGATWALRVVTLDARLTPDDDDDDLAIKAIFVCGIN